VLSCGTAWVLLATGDKLYFNDESLRGTSFARAIFPGLHPIENKFGLMTSVPFGGNSLKWYRDEMRVGFSYEQLNAEAERTPIGSENLFFLPISSTKSGRGAFLGIDGVHKLGHFTRAVFEGVAFANRRHLDMIRNSGVDVKNLIMIGGGAKSPVWPKIVSEVCGLPVYVPELSEAACTGAAVLAGFGSGVFSSIEEGCAKTAGKKREILPEKANIAVYNALYTKFIESLNGV
jgi:xylulokinase